MLHTVPAAAQVTAEHRVLGRRQSIESLVAVVVIGGAVWRVDPVISGCADARARGT